MNKASQLITALAAVVVVAAICAGIYLGGWWLTRDSVDRRAEINQQSFARQNALVEQILDDISEAETANIPAAQRLALVDIVCDSAAKLTGSIQLTNNATAFIAKECS